MTKVSGLLKMKPDGPYPTPEEGQTRRLSVEQVPKKDKPNETWNRLKNEGADFGAPYKVLKADQLDGKDNHGNITFSLLVEPTSAQEGAGVGVGGEGTAPAPASDKDERIARQVAAKMSARIVGYLVQTKQIAPEQVVEEVAIMTASFLPIVGGTGKVEPQPGPTNGAKETDDIPFAASLL